METALLLTAPIISRGHRNRMIKLALSCIICGHWKKPISGISAELWVDLQCSDRRHSDVVPQSKLLVTVATKLLHRTAAKLQIFFQRYCCNTQACWQK